MNQDNTADALNYDENNKAKLPTGLNVLNHFNFYWVCRGIVQ